MKKLLLTLAVALALAAPAQAHEVAGTTICPNRGRLLLCLHNHIRGHYGLPKLAPSTKLYTAARYKRDDVNGCGVFSHDPCLKGAFEVFSRAGYSGSYLGENIAYGFKGERASFQAWLNSPGHRANILNGSFTQFGSSHCGGDCRFPYLYVVDFGRPA